MDPGSNAIVEFVIDESEGDQGIHVKQVSHGFVRLHHSDSNQGKFARISCTSLLVKAGVFGPALKAGNPVTGSVTSFTRYRRLWRGVKTIRPFSTSTSSGSPDRISSRLRRGPGSTT